MTSPYSIILVLAISIYNATAFHGHSKGCYINLHNAYRRNIVMKLEYRNAKVSDLNTISELCSESFDGPFQWHQQIQRLQSIDAFKVQLTDRLNNLVAKGVKHCMIVAVDSTKPEKSSVVGFLEVGLLPSPIGLTESVIIRDEAPETGDSSSAVDTPENIELGSVNLQSVPEVVIAESTTVTVDEGSQLGDSLGSVAAGSDAPTNIDPVNSSESPYGAIDPNELVLAAAAQEAEQKRKKKREEVPYLGNVAVSSDCRRQGVGMKLVRIALKVAEKWGDPKLYVVVESDNSGAIKLYEKLKFTCVMKEEDNINRKVGRVPRIFMSIDVPKKIPIESPTESPVEVLL